MNYYVEALLLNMLFLVVFLLFIPHLIETNLKNVSANQKKLIIVISVLLAMVSCMFFPFKIGDEVNMDLRTVAVIFGGLYLGKKASVFIIVIFLVFRFYLGGLGSGFYAALIASLILLIVLVLLTKVFESFDKASKQKKVFIACGLSLFINTTALSIRVNLFNHLNSSDFRELFAFFSIHLISTFFIFYFYEMIRETAYVNKRVIKADKLEVVSHLASSISHEVRNPLTVVRGFLQMLNHKDLKEDKKRFYIEISLKEIDRANDIISNYLTFAKPAQEEHVKIDIEQELNRSINVITALANMENITIQTQIESCYIKGDSQLLQQCILNMTKNCIEAMPNGGNLTIKVWKLDGEVVIEISDSGNGMTAEQLLRIGEPFFTTKGREGTGLGMMAVMKIIDIMNGKLKVTSNLNEGTQFRIYFPSVE